VETDVRLNPSLLKLDLYGKGIRIDGSCDDERGRGRKILRTRAGLGSGLEVILPGGLWTNIPVVEPFARSSPYSLHFRSGRFEIDHERLGRVCATQLSPPPAGTKKRPPGASR
jgi:hypothetical protein